MNYEYSHKHSEFITVIIGQYRGGILHYRPALLAAVSIQDPI